jgi:hypothetical protein
MKLRRMVLGLLCALIAHQFRAQQMHPAHLKIDYMFLIDVSGSMNGIGGHPRIFPEVATTVSSFIGRLDAGTTIYFVPFAERIREIRQFTIHGPADVAVAKAYLNQLNPNGSQTAVYNSIGDALEYIKNQRREEERGTNPIIVHVYTDGDDNVSHGWTLKSILDHFNLRRGPHDWLFYTELGLPPNPQKEATFNGRDNVRYVSERAGEVRPITVVEARLPFMNFGNVMETQSPERDQQFVVRSTQPLPAGFALKVEPIFERLRSAGVLADIEPSRFPVTDKKVKLKLTLANVETLAHGLYKGKLAIQPTDPLVIVVPDDIDAVFSYEPTKKITVSAAPGEHLPPNFGTVERGATAVRHLRIAPDDEARRAAIPITFRLTDLNANPARLQLGKAVYVDRMPGKSEGAIAGGAGEITLVVRPPADLPTGDYGGTIDITAPGAQVSYEGGSPSESTFAIAWHFHVPPPPTPPWIWAVVAVVSLAIIAFLIYLATRPPRFTDLQLQLIKPRTGTIDLTGLSKKSFGPSANELPDCKADFAIVAQKRDDGIAAVIETNSNAVKIVRGGTRMDIIQQEDLRPGDRITVDEYEMRVESTALNES